MSPIFLVLFILSLIPGCIEVDISVPGFPAMASYFKVSENIIQLTVAYNFLGFCLTALLYGPLSEKYGRRPIMIMGNALLFLGGIGCVMAPTVEALLLSRFIQGLGASTSAVIVFTMIADIYQGDARSVKVISVINSVLTTLMAIAPTAGSFINQAIGWRGNYGLVTGVSFISWVLLILFLPETKQYSSSISFQSVANDYKRLLLSQKFMANSLLPSVLYGCYIAFISCASFLYIETFRLSIMAYALHQAAIICAFISMNLFTPWLNDKFKKVKCLLIGINLCTIGLVFLVSISLIIPYSPYLISLGMMVFCMGFAICYPVTFMDSLEVFPNLKGIASSAGMSLRMLVCAGCVGLTGCCYDRMPLTVFLSLVPPLGLAMGAALFIYKDETYKAANSG